MIISGSKNWGFKNAMPVDYLCLFLVITGIFVNLVYIPSAHKEYEDLKNQNQATLLELTNVSTDQAPLKNNDVKIEDVLRDVFIFSKNHHIQIPHGNYSFVQQVATNKKNYQIQIPANGSYQDVYAFIASLMNKHGSLVMTKAKLIRVNPEESIIDASLYFELINPD